MEPVTQRTEFSDLDPREPVERSEAVADLAAATDLLVHYLKRDRIPAVVRRPVARMSDRSQS